MGVLKSKMAAKMTIVRVKVGNIEMALSHLKMHLDSDDGHFGNHLGFENPH